MIAEDIISSLFSSKCLGDFRESPIVLSVLDVGDPEQFVDYIDDRLDWLCLDISSDECIIIEDEYIPIFEEDSDEGSEGEEEEEGEGEREDKYSLPIITRFKDITENIPIFTAMKVKCLKLNVLKKEREEKKKEEEEDKKHVELDIDKWTQKQEICSVDFDIPRIEKPIEKPQKKSFKKTRMCPHLDTCKKGKNCRFAHSRSELVIRKRWTDSNDILSNHFNVLFKDLPKSKPKPEPTKPVFNSSKTKMCKWKEKCRKKCSCNFAHTFEEWNPIPCSFDGRCKNKQCKFWHKKTETKEQLYQRLFH